MSAPRPDMDGIFLPDKAVCELCGEPMPAGEEMFKFHGYSGPCQPMRAPRPEGMSEDSRGLSIDVLDADRLRSWAEHFDNYGANVTHWASVSFMVEHLRGLAGRLEEAVRDVGSLRAGWATLRATVVEIQSAARAFARGQLSAGKLAEIIGVNDVKHEFKSACHSFDEQVKELATLRERVKKLPTPWRRMPLPGPLPPRYISRAWHCAWCDETVVAPHNDAFDHPDNGCLWPDVHQPARAPKEPTPATKETK